MPKIYLPSVIVPTTSTRQAKSGAATDRNTANCADPIKIGASWLYDWSPNPMVCWGIDSVPMVWNGSQTQNVLGGNSQYVLGFNEPNQRDQANMEPADAATAWRRLEIANPTRKLVSPAVILDADRPTWLQDWYAAYLDLYGQPPRIDAMACHTYRTTVAQAQADVQSIIDQSLAWDVPEGVWVTEWAFLPFLVGSAAVAQAYQAEMLAWLEANPDVDRYAWFCVRVPTTAWPAGWTNVDTSLIDAYSGELTGYGRVYNAVSAKRAEAV